MPTVGGQKETGESVMLAARETEGRDLPFSRFHKLNVGKHSKSFLSHFCLHPILTKGLTEARNCRTEETRISSFQKTYLRSGKKKYVLSFVLSLCAYWRTKYSSRSLILKRGRFACVMPIRGRGQIRREGGSKKLVEILSQEGGRFAIIRCE